MQKKKKTDTKGRLASPLPQQVSNRAKGCRLIYLSGMCSLYKWSFQGILQLEWVGSKERREKNTAFLP